MSKENKHIKFALQNIRIEQFAILSKEIEDNKNIQLNNNIKFNISEEFQIIETRISISFKQEEKTILVLETATTFVIEINSWESLKKSNSIIIPRSFLMHLAAVSFGTTRGILHTKTQDTVLENYLLPLTNFDEIIKSDLKIEIK
jgi:hypothetical protein